MARAPKWLAHATAAHGSYQVPRQRRKLTGALGWAMRRRDPYPASRCRGGNPRAVGREIPRAALSAAALRLSLHWQLADDALYLAQHGARLMRQPRWFALPL